MEEQLHRFAFAMDLCEDAVTCCGFFGGREGVVRRWSRGGGVCACVRAQLVNSRNV